MVPFLGYGKGSAAFDAVVAFADPSAAPDELMSALKSLTPKPRVAGEPGLVAINKVKSLVMLDEWPDLAFIARDNPKATGVRHREALENPAAILDVLERHLLARRDLPYEALPLKFRRHDSAHAGAWESAAEVSLLARLFRFTLSPLARAAPELLAARLPSWFGLHFAADLAVLECLTSIRGVSPSTIPLPGHFKDTFEAVLNQHMRTAGPASAKLDWSSVDAVRTAIEQRAWSKLQDALSESDAAHQRTVLELAPTERAELANHLKLATKLMNIATLVLFAGRHSDALAIYDSVLDGKLEAAAAANPLYAVQAENNKLPIDAARHRRYIDTLVPFGPKNPAVFLNAACVACELESYDEAVQLLTQAKAHGFEVRKYRNEASFAQLAKRADYKTLMK